MMPTLWVFSPSHRCDATLAVAAARAGEVGLLDLSACSSTEAQIAVVDELTAGIGARSQHWGLRWDALVAGSDLAESLAEFPVERWPLLVLAGFDPSDSSFSTALDQARDIAEAVYVEVTSLPEALAAENAGVDGLIAKGSEAAGWVGQDSTFLLLQQLRGRVEIPYVIQGSIGPDVAAAAMAAGASGVALCEQVWLATESTLSEQERQKWARFDGSETHVIANRQHGFRYSLRDAQSVQQVVCADDDELRGFLRGQLESARTPTRHDERLIPLGEGIAFASSLAERYVNVAGILSAYHTSIRENLQVAADERPLAPGSALTQTLGTEYPVLQGPMTRVSDVTPFCAAVAENGGMPFLALALMRATEVEKLLTRTKQKMGDRPWGVGILGFIPNKLRKEQLEVIAAASPQFAIIAGGRPSQARQLDEQGITTYLHVPSPGLLEVFVNDGARRFIFEGRECGGHVGPRGSVTLWQQAIDVLLEADVKQPEELEIVFAGGIHDRLSAAMVSVLAAPLVRKGMKIGVLMGTGYLFTHEAVESGAITSGFQQQALDCRATVLLESGAGHATRCLPTPFADEFETARKELIASGRPPQEIRFELELLNVGRLRLASKGVERTSDPRDETKKSTLVSVGEDEQRQRGMYMIGQLAALRDRVIPMVELHQEVTAGACELITEMAARQRSQPDVSITVKPPSDDIAIVGLAGMFPKARNVREYWENIVNGVNAIQEVPDSRWDVEAYFSEDRRAADMVYSRWGGFLQPVKFDPMKWHFPPSSLLSIDTVQLLSLEVAWQALVDAGFDKRPFCNETTGVIFAAAGSHEVGTDYCFRTMMRHYLPRAESLDDDARERLIEELEATLPEWTEDSFPGFLLNVIAGRISNRLDLRGPNYVVDAACAASMAALDTAIGHLRCRSADAMLVGTADITNNPFCYMSFAKTHALSPRGRSRPFDASADGIALGESVSAMVLKRLTDAERAGDNIYAVIRGIGSSSDGRNRSMTAPHPPGQMLALERAYADADVDPATVSLIEAHGTGTAVGDQTEISSLTQGFAKSHALPKSIAVGSVKSMIGHTKTAAGMASLIKTTLALKHKVLPPTIGVETPNEKVAIDDVPFYVNSETRPWVSDDASQPRRAGISAFGFGGTNFHVVMEEYTGGFHSHHDVNLTPRGVELFTWRAESREQIVDRLRTLQHSLTEVDPETFDSARLAELAYGLTDEASAVAAKEATCRLALLASSLDDLSDKVAQALKLLAGRANAHHAEGLHYSEQPPVEAKQVCFLYPGQGSQSVNMLRDLAVAFPESQAIFNRANAQVGDALPKPLTRYVYPPPTFDKAASKRDKQALGDTRVAQPALGMMELFATDLLRRFGIVPGMTAGHSYGEYVALHAAGALSSESLLKLSTARGRIVAQAAKNNPGAMAAVAADVDTTVRALSDRNIAARPANINGPQQTVIAGPTEAIAQAVAELPGDDLPTSRIPVSAAFHTPALEPATSKFDKVLWKTSFTRPGLPVSSNTTGELYPKTITGIRKLLSRHLTEPVQFEKQVRNLHDDGAELFIEVGPGRVLSRLVQKILPEQKLQVIALDSPRRDGCVQFAELLAHCFVQGLPVELEEWYAGRGLEKRSTVAFFEMLADEREPGMTDWILTPEHARPAAEYLLEQKAINDAESASAGEHSLTANSIETNSDNVAEPASTAVSPAAMNGVHPVVTSADQTKASVPETDRAPLTESATDPQRTELGRQAIAHMRSQPSVSPHSSQGSAPMDSALPQSHLTTHPVAAPAHRAASNGVISHGSAVHSNSQSQGMLPLVSQFLELQIAQQRTFDRLLGLHEAGHGVHAEMGHASPARALPVSPLQPVLPTASAPFPTPQPQAPQQQPQTSAPPRPTASVPKAPLPVGQASSLSVSNAPASQPTTPLTDGAASTALTSTVPTRVTLPASTPPATVSAVAESSTSELTVSDGAIPPTAVFREDLWKTVSERTGYPIAALDADLPLESGLGIDSIKTLEIFSKLQQYHSCFRVEGQDEEELLEEFSKLTTLADIVAFYDQRREAHQSTEKADATPASKKNGSASLKAGAAVERYIVEPVETKAVANSSKKKSSPTAI